ncbi:MAG: cytochrome P450 [Anaerolineae bacterium]|nr:cytochrome P450 [Anaerolineae bacterium]
MPTFDLFSPEFKANPFPTFAQMRQTAPVFAHKMPNGEMAWYITRYDDVMAVLMDNDNFIKDHRRLEARSPASNPGLQQLINQNMLFSDPPDHTRLRALVNQAFTPRRMEQMGPQMQSVADSLVDRVAGRGTMDVMADVALPFPVSVICDLLGIPRAEQDQVADWSQAIISPGRHRLSYGRRRKKVRAFVDYLRAMFADRRVHPRDDLVTALVQAEQGGDTFTETELSSMVALLLVTGHETTVNLIGNGVLALLLHPEQLARLKAEPDLLDKAIEELLRYDGPVETSTTRWARRDVEFRGHLIKRGDIVRVVLTSANRDAAHFENPDQLDLSRVANKHLGFGHGIHYCLGAPLARLEGRIALNTLLQRLPNLRLAVPVEQLRWRSGVLFRGLDQLTVIWDR